MKKLLAILSVSMLLLSAGCKQDDEVLPRQKQSIVSFLTGSHSPRLIAEEDLAASIDVDPPYYTVSGNTVYRYIANIYDADRPSRPEVGRRSRVTVTYRAYLFENRAIDARTMPYDSNDPALAEALYEAGLRAAGGGNGRRRDNKRAAAGVIGLPEGRCRRGLHDLQHGLWR